MKVYDSKESRVFLEVTYLPTYLWYLPTRCKRFEVLVGVPGIFWNITELPAIIPSLKIEKSAKEKDGSQNRTSARGAIAIPIMHRELVRS